MKVMSTLVTAFVLCAPAFADNTNNNNNAPAPQPKGKRPAVSFGFRDIQSENNQPAPVKKPSPAATPAATAKPAKKGPSTKTY